MDSSSTRSPQQHKQQQQQQHYQHEDGPQQSESSSKSSSAEAECSLFCSTLRCLRTATVSLIETRVVNEKGEAEKCLQFGAL